MNRARPSQLWLAVLLLAANFLRAETVPALPPLPRAIKPSPVELFRQLLELSPVEQKNFLTNRPPEQQQRILAKVREYESLKPDARELRLRATELAWYLTPLLKCTATNRAEKLAALPDEPRREVTERLREWDKLSAAAQADLLANETTLRYFTQSENGNPAALASISPARREKLQAGVAAWRALPAEQREQQLARFNQFFELTDAEKTRALGKFTDAERTAMEKTLARFDKLPKLQRESCIRAFTKFTAMTVEERQQFLKNAERWQTLSLDARQQWRSLVAKLATPTAPPLPGLKTTPPLPPAVVTNNR
jgi:hypothetical protein